MIAAPARTGVPLVSEVSQYIISAGGKRLRPALVLLSPAPRASRARALQPGRGGRVHPYRHAAARRRGRRIDAAPRPPTANEIFGNPASVLVGDFLYSRAFQMMVDGNSMRVMQILADATNVIAEGEVLQLMNMHDAATRRGRLPARDPLQDRQAVRGQHPAGRRAGRGGAEIEEACADYGQALGTAFQVIDDVLDYAGDADETGKNLGDDLREGKTTLPLILAMQRGTAGSRAN